MRVIRFKSHINLPPEERNVKFFYHITLCKFDNDDILRKADY